MDDAQPPVGAADGDDVAAPDAAGLRDQAQAELVELGEHWDERRAEYDTTLAGDVAGEQRSLLQDAVRRFAANRTALAALGLMVLYVVLAIAVPMVMDPGEARCCNYEQASQGPSLEHPFGTDAAGRDVWLRSWIGARLSLTIAAAVSLVILSIGVLYGSISGYVGGALDNAMMRFLDALYGLPYLPFAIITVSVIRNRFPDASPVWYMVPALALTSWFTAARIMRGQMLSLKRNDYVEGARAAGAGSARIMGRHVLPNTVGIMVVAMFLEVPNAILGEAFLSFLGLGADKTSWGTMAQEGSEAIHVHPHLIWVPALLIATTVLAAIAVADGLRDALDPRGKVN